MLSPYRVLDLTDHRGEISGMILGDLGADVIKIETPAGDTTRNLGPRKNEDLASMYLASNRNKCSSMLDLMQEAGQIIPMSAWWH